MLSPKEVSEVIIGPKVLDFGKVTVGSRNVKSFFVSNDLKTHVLVTVPVNIRDELKESFPSSQVVPPGATAGFDIVFHSTSIQTFQQAIYFTLNDHHKLKFVVFAEVVQIDLTLSHDEMMFRFTFRLQMARRPEPVLWGGLLAARAGQEEGGGGGGGGGAKGDHAATDGQEEFTQGTPDVTFRSRELHGTQFAADCPCGVHSGAAALRRFTSSHSQTVWSYEGLKEG